MPKKLAEIIQFPGVPAGAAGKAKPSNGEETATRRKRRKDGRASASYYDASGARHFFYGKSFAEATRKMEEDKEKRMRGIDPSAGKQPLSKWAAKWIEVYGQNAKGKGTNTANRFYANMLVEALGDIRIEDIREADIQEFASEQSEMSKSHVTKVRCVVNSIFNKAISNRIISYNPCTDVKWIWAGEGTHRALERDEILLIAAHYHESYYGLWAMIMLFAGLRRGEALALRWDDIDFDKKNIHVHQALHFDGNIGIIGKTKTESGVRDVPLLKPLSQALNTVPVGQRTGYVCKSKNGKAVTSNAWINAWASFKMTMNNVLNDRYTIKDGNKLFTRPGQRNDLIKNEKVFNLRAHDLRHTFCTILFDSGVDVKTAQIIMGHASPIMTMKVYDHLTQQRKDESLRGLEKMALKIDLDVKKMSKTAKTQ